MNLEKMSAFNSPKLNLTSLVCCFMLLTSLLLVGSYASAQTITAIYDFGTGTDDPLNPQYVGTIAQGRDGNMYSTTPKGGANGLGAAFKITASGKLALLHSFSSEDGTPYSGLTLGTDGNFYGTTSNGGNDSSGTVFKMTPTGTLTVLYTFTGGNDGKSPMAPPIQATNGNFYGTTLLGGLDGAGTVYELTPAGKLTTLVQFNETDGTQPLGPLVQANDGNFYGTTTLGNNNCGFDDICATIFKVTPSGAFTQLHSFPFNSFFNSVFANGLVLANNGALYGTVVQSGIGHGEVFKITTAGVFTDVYDFTGGNDGGNPYAGLLLGTDGNLYGVTAADGNDGFGELYEIVTATGKFIPLAPFTGTNGAGPTVGLIQNTTGIIYSAANTGGQTTNIGTFYKVSGLPLEKPFVSLVTDSGAVGATVEILGQGLTSTTEVSFNGTSATFKAVSNNYLTAVVPTGATSGAVTVTTSSGVLKSKGRFQVTK